MDSLWLVKKSSFDQSKHDPIFGALVVICQLQHHSRVKLWRCWIRVYQRGVNKKFGLKMNGQIEWETFWCQVGVAGSVPLIRCLRARKSYGWLPFSGAKAEGEKKKRSAAPAVNGTWREHSSGWMGIEPIPLWRTERMESVGIRWPFKKDPLWSVSAAVALRTSSLSKANVMRIPGLALERILILV